MNLQLSFSSSATQDTLKDRRRRFKLRFVQRYFLHHRQIDHQPCLVLAVAVPPRHGLLVPHPVQQLRLLNRERQGQRNSSGQCRPPLQARRRRSPQLQHNRARGSLDRWLVLLRKAPSMTSTCLAVADRDLCYTVVLQSDPPSATRSAAGSVAALLPSQRRISTSSLRRMRTHSPWTTASTIRKEDMEALPSSSNSSSRPVRARRTSRASRGAWMRTRAT